MKRQFIVLVLSFCILFNLVPSVASATEIEPNEMIITADPSEWLIPYQGIMPREPAGLEYLLFTMSASQLTNELLTTRTSGKYFEKDQIPSDGYLFYTGKLTAKNTRAAAGICYYIYATGKFSSIHETSFPSDKVTSSG